MARKPPIFLERETYRRNRVFDAARLLPFLGALFVAIPLLWSQGSDGVSTSAAAIYLFVIWGLMILGAAVVSVLLRRSKGPEE